MTIPRIATTAILVLLTLYLQPVEGQEKRLDEQDVARIRTVISAEISPAGNQIAYLLSVPRDLQMDDNGPAYSQLHVVDLQGNSRAFVGGKVNISSLQWKPDGTGLTFLARRDGDASNAIYELPIDGGEARKLVSHESSISGYCWHPSGNQIAFLATQPEDSSRAELRNQGFDAEIYEEQLRPVQIWITEGDFAENRSRVLNVPGSASEISFSPDGKRLVAAIAPTPLIDDFYMYRRVRILAPDTGQILAKIDNPGKLGSIRFSPDGQWLAICSGEDINDPKTLSDARPELFHRQKQDEEPVPDRFPHLDLDTQLTLNSLVQQSLNWIADQR